VKVGDLVGHWKFGTGIVIKLHGPTPTFAYQIAKVAFSDSHIEELVTTSLHPIYMNGKE